MDLASEPRVSELDLLGEHPADEEHGPGSATTCDHHEGRARDQVVGLENTIDTGFREEMSGAIGELPGQLAGRALRIRQRGVHDLLPQRRRNPIPIPARGLAASPASPSAW